MEYYDKFTVFSFLKVKSTCHSTIICCIKKELELLKNENIIEDYKGPFYVFGQYDIFYLYSVKENMRKGSRLYYAIITYINSIVKNNQCPHIVNCEYKTCENKIFDFHQMIGFEWNTQKLEKSDSTNVIGYSFVKFKYPVEHIDESDLLINKILNEVKSVTSKYGISFDVYGTFSWYELLFIFYQRDNSLFYDISNYINSIPYISNSQSSLVKGEKCDFKQDKPLFLSLEITFSVSAPIKEIKAILESNHIDRYKLYHCLNFIILSMKITRNLNINNLYNKISHVHNINYIKTTVLKDLTPEHKLPAEEEEEILIYGYHSYQDRINENQKYYKNSIQALNTIEKVSLPKRKLMSLKTKVQALQNIPLFQYVIPNKIIESIDYIMDNFSDDEDIQYFISEYSSAIGERLIGAQMDTITGKDITFLEKGSSYQRLLLACESLMIRCSKIYLKTYDITINENDRPQIFVFFDTGHLSSNIPYNKLYQGFRNTMPIILRLKQLKYRPSLWLAGMKEFKKILLSFSDILKIDSQNEDMKSNKIIAEFLDDEYLMSYLQDEISLKEKDISNIRREAHVQMSEIRKKSSYLLRSWLCDKDITDFQNKIKKGIIQFNLNDEKFVNYLNAYMSLPKEIRESAKAVISYILTLYWAHPELTKKDEDNDK